MVIVKILQTKNMSKINTKQTKPNQIHEHNNSSLNNISILCRKNNAFNLSLREGILIKRDSTELNKNVS